MMKSREGTITMMRKENLRSLVLLLVAAMLLLLPSTALAQDDQIDTNDDTDYCSSPVAIYLVDELGFNCEELAAQGIGLGEIKKAWYLSMVLPGFEGDWESLLTLKASGQGWGNIKQAARLSEGDPILMEQYFALRQNDVGWGEIKKAQALVDAGLYDFEEALALVQDGLDWNAIKNELGYQGPPPWAGNNNKTNKGQPPWAGGWNGAGES